ncbi:unnamed protein product [Nezara viridula]|uniref:Uncharacterized protein n=1 Tax=Nezara viridula TaxID=85310 RepID=A0A9P0HN68_NEZVI|nr:unnamed protein product [Nezara viridula]
MIYPSLKAIKKILRAWLRSLKRKGTARFPGTLGHAGWKLLLQQVLLLHSTYQAENPIETLSLNGRLEFDAGRTGCRLMT